MFVSPAGFCSDHLMAWRDHLFTCLVCGQTCPCNPKAQYKHRHVYLPKQLPFAPPFKFLLICRGSLESDCMFQTSAMCSTIPNLRRRAGCGSATGCGFDSFWVHVHVLLLFYIEEKSSTYAIGTSRRDDQAQQESPRKSQINTDAKANQGGVSRQISWKS